MGKTVKFKQRRIYNVPVKQSNYTGNYGYSFKTLINLFITYLFTEGDTYYRGVL